jgi:predicted secreted protein
MKKNILLLSSIVILVSSCQKEELPVPAHDPGDIITATVNMESDYKWQIYYDLKTNTVVGQNLKTRWDLGFESSPNGFHIILNSSKAMFARNTGITDFLSVTDTIGFSASKKWDEASGNLDSTAIGDWRNTNNVYVIDRGYDEAGVHQGFRKIQFQSVDANKYIVRLAQLNGTGDTTLQINKDSAYNFTFLSFNNNDVVLIEPPKTTWDLVFTQYTHIFYDGPPMPYLVTGCLLNRYNTEAKMDSLITFSSINLAIAENYILSSKINTIGYEWKVFTGGTFKIKYQMNYIIKDSEGYYYKLRFIDFYNSSGVKGNPKWEYQQL